MQLVLEPAAEFFGGGTASRSITAQVFIPPAAADPAFTRTISVSKEYANGTRRINKFPELGALPSCFVVFEETDDADVYKVWWEFDKAIVAAYFDGWTQGKNSQYGRGRLSIIVDAPVPREMDRLL